jgi:hypothetical protein
VEHAGKMTVDRQASEEFQDGKDEQPWQH